MPGIVLRQRPASAPLIKGAIERARDLARPCRPSRRTPGARRTMASPSLSPPGRRLSRSLCGSCREENTPAEQVEAGAPVHLPLDQLEPGDLALGLAAAPGRRECRPDRSAVLLQARRKRLE